jgi:hypothetical protein
MRGRGTETTGSLRAREKPGAAAGAINLNSEVRGLVLVVVLVLVLEKLNIPP